LKLTDFRADLNKAEKASWLNGCVDKFSQAQYDGISADFNKNSVTPIIMSRNLLAIYVWGCVGNLVLGIVFLIIMIIAREKQ